MVCLMMNWTSGCTALRSERGLTSEKVINACTVLETIYADREKDILSDDLKRKLAYHNKVMSKCE